VYSKKDLRLRRIRHIEFPRLLLISPLEQRDEKVQAMLQQPGLALSDPLPGSPNSSYVVSTGPPWQEEQSSFAFHSSGTTLETNRLSPELTPGLFVLPGQPVMSALCGRICILLL
jgi:hypothetical protein